MQSIRNAAIWIAVATALLLPLLLAVNSPLLQWREPVYITAGIAGVIAMSLLVLQPLLASGYLPGVNRLRSRQLHRVVGSTLVLMIIAHVAGLWITSPPDVIDALLFRSATSFSLWGVIAMWAIFSTATLAAVRKIAQIKPHIWKITHKTLAAIIVISSAIHAILIDGTMESFSKYAICILLLGVTFLAIANPDKKK